MHTGDMGMCVWVDGWQMQCCGDPFAVGSEVRWTLIPPDHDWFRVLLGNVEVDAVEEHHGGEKKGQQVTVGAVSSIDAVYVKRAPVPNGSSTVLYPVEGTSQLLSRTSVTGWEGDSDGVLGLRFEGYLVDLDVKPQLLGGWCLS